MFKPSGNYTLSDIRAAASHLCIVFGKQERNQIYVKVSGENLGSVEKALLQGTILKTKNVSDDGKTMEPLVTEEMSAVKEETIN